MISRSGSCKAWNMLRIICVRHAESVQQLRLRTLRHNISCPNCMWALPSLEYVLLCYNTSGCEYRRKCDGGRCSQLKRHTLYYVEGTYHIQLRILAICWAQNFHLSLKLCMRNSAGKIPPKPGVGWRRSWSLHNHLVPLKRFHQLSFAHALDLPSMVCSDSPFPSEPVCAVPLEEWLFEGLCRGDDGSFCGQATHDHPMVFMLRTVNFSATVGTRCERGCRPRL